ncbi:bile-acid 7-alpha dehydratase [Williamsia sp. 1138]|uniref:nuclear transport factor 2 family protein n=1 Tax=Williamsia sp. 1138 TaxID=1903117 RepID=UPI000A100745|nr:nuclear transport factor 2 family protein [Williamsia sp. 1138]OZG28692.1 bile-acid 7-alpha dehydratase [Williamsia sp. 1138]
MADTLTLSPVEQLLALEEIKRVFSARLRCMDNKQWHLYPTFHTTDVISETFADLPVDGQPTTDGVTNRVVGNELLGKTIEAVLDGDKKITSVHHGHTPEIDLTSDTTATGVWAMEDKLWWINTDGTEEHLHGYGHYHEEYRCVDGKWLISFRSLSRLRVDETPRFHEAVAAP